MSGERFVYYEHKGADYILDTPNTELDFIEMLGDALETEEICEKLNEQQATINKLKEENKQLRQQLLYEGDNVCSICKHEYLVPTGDYFIAKCKKEHKECSKKDIKYCEDFELIQADFRDFD